jgi:tetratricopeptide (TPR) repeat protein
MRSVPFAFLIALATAGIVGAQSNPFDGLDTRGRAYTDPAVYARAKAQWLARVEAMPENVDVLEGAADFFAILDRPLALELFERASALEPNNPRWMQKLAQMHRLNAASGDVAEAQTALSLMERIYAVGPAEEQATVLTNLPAAAFDAGDIGKARTYAARLLDESTRQANGWNRGNAVHQGNLILGRVAVAEGRLSDGVKFLRAAGETPGSPQLDSFGPNMSLAKDLLERGETAAVLAYFEACRRFWKLGGTRLDAWRQDVEAGRIPNFGANLHY